MYLILQKYKSAHRTLELLEDGEFTDYNNDEAGIRAQLWTSKKADE
jgi:hypothetical protein